MWHWVWHNPWGHVNEIQITIHSCHHARVIAALIWLTTHSGPYHSMLMDSIFPWSVTCDHTVYPKKYAHGFCFAVLFVVIIHWLIFPYPSALLHWHCGNLTIAPLPAKQPWWIWINTSCGHHHKQTGFAIPHIHIVVLSYFFCIKCDNWQTFIA